MYNISLFNLLYSEDGDKELNLYELGILCTQLPPGSRVMREMNIDLAWDDTTNLIVAAEYNTRCLLHAFLSYAAKGYKPEKDLEPFKPVNKDSKKYAKDNKLTLDIEGEGTIQPVSKEELAQMFGHELDE